MSKGSKQRPRAISCEAWAKNYDQAYKTEWRVIDTQKMRHWPKGHRFAVVRILPGQLTQEIIDATVGVHYQQAIADLQRLELE